MIFRRFGGSISLCYLALSLSGCASPPGLKAARVTPEGTKESFVGVTTSGAHLPELQGGLRIGVWPKFDVEARLALFGMSGFEGRYQFFDQERFAASVGVLFMAGGISFDSTQTDPRTGEKQEVRSQSSDFVGDLGIPLYLGYDIDFDLSIYFSPRLIARQRRDGIRLTDDTRVQFLTGMKIGKQSGAYLESGAEYSSRENSWIGRLAIAFFWK